MHFSTWIYLRRENKNLQCNCPFLITNWHLSRAGAGEWREWLSGSHD